MRAFLKHRRYKKLVKHLLHEIKHVYHYREDVTDPRLLNELTSIRDRLREAWRNRDYKAIDNVVEKLEECVGKIYPQKSFARLRENLEILAVALAVAMAFRTYFIQPFKIPTGSMQPTLYGITFRPQQGKTPWDYFPLSLGRLALFGEKYKEVKAQNSGQIDTYYERVENDYVLYINGVPHKIPVQMQMFCKPGNYVEKGNILASGLRVIGDHIFVNKVIYNFSRPERGDIIVFDTNGIEYPGIKKDTFYIKRLAGMPGDTIQIDPPYLVANGKKVVEPYPFQRLVEDKAGGYRGYSLARESAKPRPKLAYASDRLELNDDQMLPLGDNTDFSLDGRYFGSINRGSIVGPAFAVYWPLSKRWWSRLR